MGTIIPKATEKRILQTTGKEEPSQGKPVKLVSLSEEVELDVEETIDIDEYIKNSSKVKEELAKLGIDTNLVESIGKSNSENTIKVKYQGNYEYEYQVNSNGELVLSSGIKYNDEGTIEYKCTADYNGNITTEMYYLSPGTPSKQITYTYDEKGNKTEASEVDFTSITQTIKKYDAGKLTTLSTKSLKSGKEIYKASYDLQERKTTETFSDESGNRLTTSNYTYNDSELTTKVTIDYNAGTKTELNYVNGEVQKQTVYDASGNVISENTAADIFRNSLVDISQKYLGVPYVYGGTSPSSGMDCSFFVKQVYSEMGITLERTADAQYSQDIGRNFAYGSEELKPGDLIFNHFTGSSGIGHVCMYIGDGLIIEESGNQCQINTLEYMEGWSTVDGVKRVIEDDYVSFN